MLKFKVTKGNMGMDTKPLEVIDFERLGSSVYEATGTDGNEDVTENKDKVEYKFTVKNLYGLQYGSRLNAISSVSLGGENDVTKTNYEYFSDLMVTSVSKDDNSFTVSIDKEFDLNATSVSISSVYHIITFDKNNWIMELSSHDSIDKLASVYENIIRITTDEVAYGENLDGTYTAFYYENDSWKSINFNDENLEGCLSGDEVDFSSIKEYKTDKYKAKELINEDGKEKDRLNLYFTVETYVELSFSPSHYFQEPIEEHELVEIEDGDVKMTIPKTNEFYTPIVKDINYPIVYFHMNSLKIAKECHIYDANTLTFNYDNLTKVFTYEEKQKEKGKDPSEPNENTKAIYPIVIETEYYEGTLEKMYSDAEERTTYRRLTKSEVESLENCLFPDSYYTVLVSGFGDDIVFEEDDEFYETELQYGTAGVSLKRDTFIFNDELSTTSLSYDNAATVVQIPLSMKFETDLFHNDALQTNFVDHAKANAINPINDMEKNVYTPAIQTKITDTQINTDYIDCYKIVFNLHFRKHRDKSNNGNKQEWVCDKDSPWNGNRIVEYKDKDNNTYNILDFNGRVYNFTDTGDEAKQKKTNKYDYFSYYANIPSDNYDQDDTYDSTKSSYVENRAERSQLTEYQSDLLSYLGFSNDDVKYQKSKLKKSFLRISFYDSDNIGSQNLLHTSTIFLDSGDLFAKYIKNINTEEEYLKGGDVFDKFEYSNMDTDGQNMCIPNGSPTAVIGSSFIENDTVTSYGKSGLRVNREPMRKKGISVAEGDLGDNIDDLETLRLSSQIVVTDKFSSKRSSEGFYFYTYKSNDNGVYPSEIYMRVDFNHAGYGRTIPFMMPYITESESKKEEEGKKNRYKEDERKGKIKTFEDIAYDWSEVDLDNSFEARDDEEIGYGSAKYLKYSYIKWKYRYDKDTQKHIYYLDPDIYGDSVISSNGHGHNIILNLYEGRIK